MASRTVWILLGFLALSRAQSDSENIAREIGKLTEAINNQKVELLTTFQDMKEELKQEIGDMIDEAKVEWNTMNNRTRNDLSTLQQLLDADECTDLTNNCSTDATCTDTRVSFRCNCKKGFTGDGHTCEDIDECAETNRCGTYATCTNYPGGYKCKCNSGFQGDGETCEDVDECSEGASKCHKYAICKNTIGSYTCTCTLYHEGNGFICREVAMAGCTEPFKSVKGVGCIHIIEKSQNFDSSRQSCEKLGGDLFVAINPDHFRRLAQYFIDSNQKAKKKYMYVGVKEGVWLNGRKVAPEEEAPRNPTMGSGTCSYTDGDTDEKFLLWTDPCHDTWWALCEKKV